MPKEMNEKLKPCPFCDAELFEGKNVHHKNVMRHPYKTDCPLSVASWLDTAGFHERWNCRTQPDDPPLDEKEIVKSRQAQFDSDSLECLNCHNDVTHAVIDGTTHCPFCGQRIQKDGDE